MDRAQRMALAVFFGVAVFISKITVPTPMDKAVIVVQALLLALGSLLLGSLGATFVAMIGGFLTALLRGPLAPFTIGFALLYGLLMDASVSFFKVKTSKDVRAGRLIAAVTLSTTLTGLTSYYVTVYLLALLPRNLILEILIIVAGVISGLIGGYLATVIWKRIRHLAGI